jgi:hypothetical protein
MTTSGRPRSTQGEAPARTVHPVWSALVGLASLGVLLQGLWAGLFLRPDAGGRGTWVALHQHGAEATVVLALLATVAAAVWMRARRDLVVATAVFLVLLLAEMFLGMAIDASSGAVVVHVPLAMLLMGMAVWLPMAARRR